MINEFYSPANLERELFFCSMWWTSKIYDLGRKIYSRNCYIQSTWAGSVYDLVSFLQVVAEANFFTLWLLYHFLKDCIVTYVMLSFSPSVCFIRSLFYKTRMVFLSHVFKRQNTFCDYTLRQSIHSLILHKEMSH